MLLNGEKYEETTIRLKEGNDISVSYLRTVSSLHDWKPVTSVSDGKVVFMRVGIAVP